MHQLGNFQERMLRSFRAVVDDWDETCSALGTWEAEHLTKDNPRPALKQHRRTVATLLSWGQLLQRATRQPEFPDKALPARIDARVRHLEDKLAIWLRQSRSASWKRLLSEPPTGEVAGSTTGARRRLSVQVPPMPPRKLKGC